MSRPASARRLFEALRPSETLSAESAADFARELREMADKVEAIDFAASSKASKGAPRAMDFGKWGKRYVALEVLYLGHDYCGLAIQNDVATVEGELFGALQRTRLIPEGPVDLGALRYSRAGRTDRGVSGLRQVVVLDVRSGARVEEDAPPAEAEIDYPLVLNRVLPPAVRVTAWADAPNGFSARFDALHREYKYLIVQRPPGRDGHLDLTRMREAARHLLGRHDFRNFCKIDVQQVRHFEREILDFRIEPMGVHGADGSELLALYVRGTAFLWHQVRCMAAVLLGVGQGLEDPDIIRQLLDVRTESCKPIYAMASDEPLFLYECAYRERTLLWQRTRRNVHAALRSLRETEHSHLVRAAMVGEMIRVVEEDGALASGPLPPPSGRPYVPLLRRPREPALGDRAGAAGGVCVEAAELARAARGSPSEGVGLEGGGGGAVGGERGEGERGGPCPPGPPV